MTKNTKPIDVQYSLLLGTGFTVQVPEDLHGDDIDKYIKDHWDTLIDPCIDTADLDTMDTLLEIGSYGE